MAVLCGVSVLPAEDLRAASAPLFEQGLVDAVEWSLDFGWGDDGIPDWVTSLLDEHEARGTLFAHGVELSPMSAVLQDHQHAWLASLRRSFKERQFRHLTEHYGFMTAGDVVRGTPLPIPPSKAALRIAVERVRMLSDVTGGPVGIENLAFAFGRDDALAQASFVRRLCEASGAFVLLDVHNLHCQAQNFDIDPLELAEAYGLDAVREIHVAGGGTTVTRSDPSRPFRRDSHDDDVPPGAFELLARVVPRCSKLELVILERSDRSVFSAVEADRYRADFRRLREIVAAAITADGGPITTRPFPRESASSELIDDDAAALEGYQRALLDVLTRDGDPSDVGPRLATHPGAALYRAHTTSFERRALEVGAMLAREWCARTGDEETTMATAVLRRPGSPLESIRLPVPSPGPGQVLVRTLAVGLCGTDAHACAGSFPLPMPIVLGHEAVGVVEAVGPGVTGLAQGDRVGVSWVQRTCGVCPACARGDETRCAAPRTWVENGGGLSELFVAEATGCTRLPDGLPAALAAPLFCAGHVAYSALLRAAPRPTDRVAVLGLGGLGHLAVGITRALGHEVVVITRREDKAKDALALGAHAAVASADPAEALQSLGGADIVLATTSAMSDVSSAVGGLRDGGRLVLVGLGDGPLTVDPTELVQREASLIGAVQGPRADLRAVLDLVAQGKVLPRVETFPLHLVNRAMSRLADGRVRYRAVISFE